jgi:hypothetical protein
VWRRHCRQEELGQFPSDRKWTAGFTLDGGKTQEKGGFGQAPERSTTGGGAHLRWGGDTADRRGSVSSRVIDNGRRRSPSMERRGWRRERSVRPRSRRKSAAALTFDGETTLESGGARSAPRAIENGRR